MSDEPAKAASLDEGSQEDQLRLDALSWADRLTAAVDELPVPATVTYATLALLLAVAFVVVQAWFGAYAAQGFFGWHIFIAVQPLVPLAAIHYLDRVAAEAILRFRSALKGGEEEFLTARRRLTTMPAQGPRRAGWIGVGISLVLFVLIQDLDTSYELARLAAQPVSIGVFLGYILVAWYFFGMWVYHTIHQLRVIHELYVRSTRVDPFYTEPITALSSITSRTAIVILANSYGWFGVNAASAVASPVNVVALILTNLFFLGLGLVIFLWPLWGAHRLLVEAKNEARARNANHVNTAVEELHRQISDRRLASIEDWEKALSALSIERGHLEGMPTWPWAPGSLRNLIAALVVPILIWVAQFGLERLLR